MRTILETYNTGELKKFISKTNIKGYSKLKRADLIALMTRAEHIGKFRYIKTKVKQPPLRKAKVKVKEVRTEKAVRKVDKAPKQAKQSGKQSKPKSRAELHKEFLLDDHDSGTFDEYVAKRGKGTSKKPEPARTLPKPRYTGPLPTNAKVKETQRYTAKFIENDDIFPGQSNKAPNYQAPNYNFGAPQPKTLPAPLDNSSINPLFATPGDVFGFTNVPFDSAYNQASPFASNEDLRQKRLALLKERSPPKPRRPQRPGRYDSGARADADNRARDRARQAREKKKLDRLIDQKYEEHKADQLYESNYVIGIPQGKPEIPQNKIIEKVEEVQSKEPAPSPVVPKGLKKGRKAFKPKIGARRAGATARNVARGKIVQEEKKKEDERKKKITEAQALRKLEEEKERERVRNLGDYTTTMEHPDFRRDAKRTGYTDYSQFVVESKEADDDEGEIGGGAFFTDTGEEKEATLGGAYDEEAGAGRQADTEGSLFGIQGAEFYTPGKPKIGKRDYSQYTTKTGRYAPQINPFTKQQKARIRKREVKQPKEGGLTKGQENLPENLKKAILRQQAIKRGEKVEDDKSIGGYFNKKGKQEFANEVAEKVGQSKEWVKRWVSDYVKSNEGKTFDTKDKAFSAIQRLIEVASEKAQREKIGAKGQTKETKFRQERAELQAKFKAFMDSSNAKLKDPKVKPGEKNKIRKQVEQKKARLNINLEKLRTKYGK